MNLENKVAIVTGGSRGIGKAITLALAEAGADVAFTYDTQSVAAEEVRKQISALGVRCIALQMNVLQRSSIEKAFADIVEEFGKIDILVNNAGVNKPTDFDKITDEDWDWVLDVNLKGPFICSQAILPYLKTNGGGSVINIGSVSGQYGGPRTAHYATSKAGLISLSQVIARFGAKDNVRCNTIAAGLIASEMAETGLKSAAVSEAAKNILLQRFGSAVEVAKTVVFLASDDSSYITAQTINVNGGLYF